MCLCAQALRERQVADAELARTRQAAEAEAAAAILKQAQQEAGQQAEVLRAECESLRAQIQDTRVREDHAKL